MPESLLANNEATIGDIETLLIHSLGTIGRGNSKEESFQVAQRWEQVWWHERDDYLNRALEQLGR